MAYTASQIQANRDRLRASQVQANRDKFNKTEKPVAIKTSTGVSKISTPKKTSTQPKRITPTEARVSAVLEKNIPQTTAPVTPTATRKGVYDKTSQYVYEGGIKKLNPDYIPNAQKIGIKNEQEQMLRDKYYQDVTAQNKYISQSQQNLANRQAGIQSLADLSAAKIEEADRKQRRYARDQIRDVRDLASQSIEAQNIAREQSQANYERAMGIAEEDRQANRIRALRRIASANIAGGSTAMSMQQEVDETFNDTINQLTDDQNYNERLIANAISTINTNANKEIRAINESLLSPVQKQQAIQQIRLEAQNKGFELEDIAMQRQQEAERYASQQYGSTLDKILGMRDVAQVRAEDKRRYEQGLMTAQEQRNYERSQTALNQKLKGLEYMINSTPYGQSVQVPQELQQALGLPSTIRGGDNTMIDNALKSMQLSQGQLNLTGTQLDLAKQRGELGLVSVIPGQSGNRPDRNNNPGNLRAGGKTDSGGFTIFDTPEAGFQAMVQDITAKLTGNSPAIRAKLGRNAQTLLDVISVYAPKGDGNEPVNYAKSVASQMGLSDINTPVTDLIPRVQELAKAMARHEGFTGDIILGESQQLGTQESLLVEKLLKPGGTKEERDDNRKRITTLINQGITDEQELSKIVYGQDLTPEKLKSVNILADDLRNNQKYKNMVDIENGYLNVKSGIEGNNAQGDLALVYGFNKMLDPGSVVREGEFATTEEAQGLIQKMLNWKGKIMSGDRLLPEVRQAFLKQASDLYDKKAIDFNSTVGKNFKDRARAYGIEPELIGQLDFNQNNVNNAVKASKPGIQYSKPAGPQKPLSKEDEDIASKYGIN